MSSSDPYYDNDYWDGFVVGLVVGAVGLLIVLAAIS